MLSEEARGETVAGHHQISVRSQHCRWSVALLEELLHLADDQRFLPRQRAVDRHPQHLAHNVKHDDKAVVPGTMFLEHTQRRRVAARVAENDFSS